MRSIHAISALTATAFSVAAAVPTPAQAPDPITKVEITAHVLQPQAVPPADASLQGVELPLGFALHRFADGLDGPRMMRVSADGTVHVTQRTSGNLVMLRDLTRDGVADVQQVVLEGIPLLHGIEIRGDRLYLTAVHDLWTASLLPDGSVGNLQTAAPDTPGFLARPVGLAELPDGSLLVSDDGNNMILRVAYGAVAGKPAPQQLAAEIFADVPATIEVRSPVCTNRGRLDRL